MAAKSADLRNSYRKVDDLHGGRCEIRMTKEERDRCRDHCAKAGDPPCFDLPSKTSDWPKGKAVEPCKDCRTKKAVNM